MLHSTKISVKPYKLCAEPQERKTRPAESPDTSQNQIIRQICLRELCKRDIGALVPTTSLTIHPSARPSIYQSIQPAFRSQPSALTPRERTTQTPLAKPSQTHTDPSHNHTAPTLTSLPPTHPSLRKKNLYPNNQDPTPKPALLHQRLGILPRSSADSRPAADVRATSVQRSAVHRYTPFCSLESKTLPPGDFRRLSAVNRGFAVVFGDCRGGRVPAVRWA